ncbi:hypothetical protein [Priestia megaterium]|nr:hypothetical protein [Priestia megaterium]
MLKYKKIILLIGVSICLLAGCDSASEGKGSFIADPFFICDFAK